MALANIDPVVELIKNSPDAAEARTRLMAQGWESDAVQKLLERLQTKGCVERTEQGRAHVFTATVDRSLLIARKLQDTADRLCDGALGPLLTHLVSSRELGPAVPPANTAASDCRPAASVAALPSSRSSE